MFLFGTKSAYITTRMGGGSFFKVGCTNGNPKTIENCRGFELATVTSQALEYDVINVCQHVQAILCNILYAFNDPQL